MDKRYEDGQVASVFSLDNQYCLWTLVEQAVVIEQGEMGIIPEKAAEQVAMRMPNVADGWPRKYTDEILELEIETKHDVAAFLAWLREKVGEDAGRWVHHGLTSSDLVDTAAAVRFLELRGVFEARTRKLAEAVYTRAIELRDAPALAYTHGQPAEPTTLGIRILGWAQLLDRCAHRVDVAWNGLLVAKLSGPVGTFAHNPPELERRVARELGLTPLGGQACSQVVPRDRLAAWASAVAGYVQAIAKVGVDLRRMADRFEFSEAWPRERVGSSAMPHKRNPVNAEKLSGMARLAAGYASMLQPVDLWDERDISHSSVERVAVPDLLHVLAHSMHTLMTLINHGRFHDGEAEDNLIQAGAAPYSSWYALKLAREHAFPADEARQGAQTWVDHYTHGVGTETPDPLELTARHPLRNSALDK